MTTGTAELSNDAILKVLRTVQDPELHQDLVTLGMIKDVAQPAPGQLKLVVELTTPACPLKDKIGADIKAALGTLPGFASVDIDWTARVSVGLPKDKAALVPTIKNIIGVSAGKGGVGKTTVACNLAVALAQAGASVGLLDSDIYGPNTPILMGLTGTPRVLNNKIQPLESHGVRVMSMGFLIDPDKPVTWRGPMLNKALTQFFADVAWGDLDYLVVDLPPGTGDVQLSLFQLVPINGIVVVTTPQAVALADVRKGIVQWRQFNVPVLGLVENMSYFISPTDGARLEIFGHGGGKKAAEELNIPFLGDIPLDMGLRQGSDQGQPVLVREPNSALSATFRNLAGQVAAAVSVNNFQRAKA